MLISSGSCSVTSNAHIIDAKCSLRTSALSHRIKSTVADLQSEVEEALEQVQSALSSTDAVTDRQSSHQQAGPRLVMRDGVHLFDPLANHHHVLAQHGAATTAPG